MYTRKAFSPHYIKRIFQELYFSYIRYNNLFTVHFKEEFAFYEPSYWLLYTLDTTFGFTEYQRSVCLIKYAYVHIFQVPIQFIGMIFPSRGLKEPLGGLSWVLISNNSSFIMSLRRYLCIRFITPFHILRRDWVFLLVYYDLPCQRSVRGRSQLRTYLHPLSFVFSAEHHAPLWG